MNLESDGYYRCDKCNESFDQCFYRYILSIRLHDHSDAIWATAFDDAAYALLKMTANELKEIRDTDNEQFDKIINNVGGKMFDGIIKVRSGENNKPRMALNNVEIHNPKKAMEMYIKDIDAYINNN